MLVCIVAANILAAISNFAACFIPENPIAPANFVIGTTCLCISIGITAYKLCDYCFKEQP